MADQLPTVPDPIAPGTMPDGIVARVHAATGVVIREDRIDCRLDGAGVLPDGADLVAESLAVATAAAGRGGWTLLYDGDTGEPHCRLEAAGVTVYSAAGVRMVHDALAGVPDVVVTFAGDALDLVAPSFLRVLEPDA